MFEREASDADKREVAVDPMTRAVAFDAKNVVEARQRSMVQQLTRAADSDDPGLMVTRLVLADHFNQKRDRTIIDGIPMASEVQAVTAYGSYRDFRARKGEVVAKPNRAGTHVMTFNWPFLVPADSERTPKDLLKQAVDLANTDEVLAWREAANRWRADAMMRGLVGCGGRPGARGTDQRLRESRATDAHRDAHQMGIRTCGGRGWPCRHCGLPAGRRGRGKRSVWLVHSHPRHPRRLGGRCDVL